MSIKIKETIKRECCQHQDLKEYKGTRLPPETRHTQPFFFCKHCGQLWEATRRMNAAGGTESHRQKVVIIVYHTED